MKRFFITGATGFVGHRLLNLMKSSEFEVRTLSRKPHPNYETVICNLQSEVIPEDALTGIDTVFHLAGFAHDLGDANKVEKLYRAVNVDATVHLAELAVQQDVQHFVFVSSVKAGGSAITGRCMTEEDQGEPEGIYGKTKREAELKLLKIGLQSSMQVSIVRPSLVYGPGVKGNLKLMLSGIEKGWFPPLPEVNNRRSLIHVNDLVRALVMVAGDDRADGEIFIATDGVIHSSREIYEAMCGLLGKEVPRWSVPKFLFDSLAIISPQIRYQVNKLFGDECYSSKKLQAFGFNAQFGLKDWK